MNFYWFQVYNLKSIAELIDLPGAFFIGAGAGSSRLTGVNCELMPNSHLKTETIKSRFAKVDPKVCLKRSLQGKVRTLITLNCQLMF